MENLIGYFIIVTLSLAASQLVSNSARAEKQMFSLHINSY